MIQSKKVRLTMLTGTTVLATVFIALGLRADAPSNKPAQPDAQKEQVDPKSMEALKRMNDYLKTLKEYTVRADTTKDELVHKDFKLQRDYVVTLTVRNPDRLRAEVEGGDNKLFVYDGKSLAVYSPTDKYFAIMPAAPTIRETLDVALAQHGLEMPLADFMYAAGGENLGASVVASSDIGPSKIAGADCEQYAFRAAKVDWQLWIENGDRPLPRKIVITTRDAPASPQYEAVLTWDLSPRINDATFVFTPPDGAKPIAFGPQTASGGNLPKTTQEKR